MSNIVLLSTVYLEKPSANGICARNLVKELKKFGHTVDVVCYKGKNSVVQYSDDIHEIEEKKQPKHGPIGKITRIVKRIPGSLTKDACKLLDQSLVNSYYEELCKLNDIREIDAVVAMFFPLEGLQAACSFKNRFPHIKTLVYELDSVGDGIASSRRQLYYNKIYERWLKEAYSKIDSIIVMESHKSYWENTFCGFRNKVNYADIPVLVRRDERNTESIDRYSMLYSGIIEKQYRSPTYLLDTLICLKDKIEFTFKFFSKGDCEEEIELASQKYQGIKNCGFVTPEELDEQIEKSEFLVSIGNSISRSVPSKIISYISCGKPIIHFSLQTDDVCAEYLKNYSASLIVDQNDAVEYSAERVYQFLKNNRGVRIAFDEVRHFFVKNDPFYSAQLIHNSLELK